MSSKVKYKGSVIAELNTNTSKTLKTSGTYCEADIVVENTQDGGITPSGTKEITDNGTYDVTEYASANVNVPKGITPSGQIEITENGTFDVTNFASALVNVSGGIEWITYGEFTPQTNLTQISVSLSDNKKPLIALAYANDINETLGYMHKLSIGVQKTNEITSASIFNNSSGVVGGFVINYTAVSEMTSNSVTFVSRGGNYMFKAGYTYTYLIIYEEK